MALTWSLGIEDGVSAPANRARDALVRYRAELARLQKSSGLLGAPGELATQQKIARAVFDVQLRQVAALQKAQAKAAAMDLRRQQDLGAYAQRNANIIGRLFSQSGPSGSWGFRAWGKDTEAATARLEQYRRTQAATIGDMSTMASIGGTVLTVATAITAAFAAIAVQLASVVARLGEGLLRMVAFREGALTTFRTMSGASTAGGRERDSVRQFAWAQQLARETPLDEQGVISSMQQASTAGFRGGAQRRAVLAAADVGAANPNDSTAASRYLRAIGQIQSRGRLQAEELNQLGEVGVGRQDIYQSLGRQLGLRETGTALSRRIEQMMRAGRITGAQGVQAAQDAVQTRFSGGGALGSFARSQGQTLGGTLSNLESSVFGLVTSIQGLENLPGIVAVKNTLNAVASALNGSSPAGRRLQGVLVMVINTAGRLFDRYLRPERVEGFFGAIADYAPVVLELVQSFGGGFLEGLQSGLGPLMALFREASAGPGGLRQWVGTVREFGRALGWVVGFAIRITTAFFGVSAALVVMIADMGRAFEWLTGLPGQMVDGMIQGLREAWPRLVEELTSLAASLPGPVRTVLGIHSPSRVFAELGQYTAQGFAVGLDAGAPQINDAMGAMTAPTVDLSGLRGGGPSITIEVNVTGGGDDLAAQIRAELSDLFADLFERGALAGGP